MSDKEFYEQEADLFFKALGRKAGKVVKYSMLIRFVINLLMNKLNVMKAVKDSKSVLRLGLACATFSVVYHLTRRMYALKRQKAELSQTKKSILLS